MSEVEYLSRKWEQAKMIPTQQYWEARLLRCLQRMGVEPLVDGELTPLPESGSPFRGWR